MADSRGRREWSAEREAHYQQEIAASVARFFAELWPKAKGSGDPELYFQKVAAEFERIAAAIPKAEAIVERESALQQTVAAAYEAFDASEVDFQKLAENIQKLGDKIPLIPMLICLVFHFLVQISLI